MRRSIPMEIIHQQSEPIPCHPSPPNPRDKGHTVTRSTKRSRVYVDAISWGCTVTIITRLATTSFNVRGKNKIQIAASIGNNGNWIVQRDVKKQRPSRPGQRHIMSSSSSSHPMVAVNNILSAKDDREEKRVICNFACFRLATGWD